MNDNVPWATTSTGETMEPDEPAREPWTRAAIVVMTVLAVAGLMSAALLPRTLAEGHIDGHTYQVRAAPGLVSPNLEVVLGDQTARVRPGPRATLEDTRVVELPADGAQLTVVLGPTPRGVASVRVDSEHGVGEARVQRLLWRRVHLEVFEDGVGVAELVGIGDRGQVVEVVQPGA